MKTIKNQNRNGRPVKNAAEKKGYKVSLKMATEEYYLLKSKARLAGISLSEYIRSVVKKSEVRQRLSPEHLGHIRQLSGMANNINQIARKANAAGYAEAVREWGNRMVILDNILKMITK
jgi:predicted DNA binding CopG/RHH family protein